MKIGDYLCDVTKRLWQYYVLEPTKENFAELYKICSEQLVMIGTGKHEFFTDLAHAVEDLSRNQVEAETIRFEVLDEWYESLEVSPDVCLVYGGLWVRQLPKSENEILVDMDTRFSALYRRRGEQWELVHLHHSIPNFEQGKGEFYPKTIAQQASEAMALAKLFQRRAELDLMTGVYNHESFHQAVQKRLDSGEEGVFFLFDIDCFKQFNDNYGHLAGDSLLKLFAKSLTAVFGRGASVGRTGGDEFAVFTGEPLREKTLKARLCKLKRDFAAEAEVVVGKEHGFSAGAVFADSDAKNFADLFKRADEALYAAKKEEKGSYRVYDRLTKSCFRS